MSARTDLPPCRIARSITAIGETGGTLATHDAGKLILQMCPSTPRQTQGVHGQYNEENRTSRPRPRLRDYKEGKSERGRGRGLGCTIVASRIVRTRSPSATLAQHAQPHRPSHNADGLYFDPVIFYTCIHVMPAYDPGPRGYARRTRHGGRPLSGKG